METIRDLTHVAMQDARWADAAEGIVLWEWDQKVIVAEEAQILVDAVTSGRISVHELRGGVCWANALDAEALRLYGVNVKEGEERLERTARRVMHHAGKKALKRVGTRQKQTTRTVESNLAYRTSVRGDLCELRGQITDI